MGVTGTAQPSSWPSVQTASDSWPPSWPVGPLHCWALSVRYTCDLWAIPVTWNANLDRCLVIGAIALQWVKFATCPAKTTWRDLWERFHGKRASLACFYSQLYCAGWQLSGPCCYVTLSVVISCGALSNRQYRFVRRWIRAKMRSAVWWSAYMHTSVTACLWGKL
jgi:hypothetical protein